MSRALRLLFLLAAVAACASCTRYAAPDPFAAFGNRADRFDIQFAWNMRPTADALEVQGVAKNVRYAYVEELELQLTLFDRENRALASDTFFFIPRQIERDDWSRFTATLKASPPPGSTVRFQYRYRIKEGNDQFPWTGSFTTDALSGAYLGAPQ